MSDHLSEQQIDLYRRRNLSPSELLWVDDHIAKCEACRSRIVEEGRLEAAIRAWKADLEAVEKEVDHCTYEQIAAYVDGKLDDADLETMESHLALCLQC